MAKTKISEFSATPGNNTDIDGINIAEGCAPSGINDAIRELMSQLKDFQTGAAGDSFNGPVGTTTAAAGAFTTLSASSTVSGTGFSTYLASPPAIGGTAAAAGSFTTLSASSTVTLSGGTANGVLYLNGSKVATSGSALTFDGTNLSLTTANAIYKVPNAGGSLFDAGGNNGFYIQGTPTAYLGFYAGGNEQMRLTSTGLGIGTSSPSAKLTITGTGATGYTSLLANGTTTAYNLWRLSNTGGDLRIGIESSTAVGILTGSTNYSSCIGTLTATNLHLGTNSTVQATIDSSGNLGLGVTPSGWSAGIKAFDVGDGSTFLNPGSSAQTWIYNNAYYNSGAKYKNSGLGASWYQMVEGQHAWYTAASGTAGNAITFTQAMTLDASGNLALGKTSASSRLEVQGAIYSPAANFKQVAALLSTDAQAINTGAGLVLGGVYTGTSTTAFAQVAGIKENGTDANYAGVLAFYTRPNGDTLGERARITSGGDLLVGTTSQLNNGKLCVYQGSGGCGIEAEIVGSGTAYAVYAARVNNTANLLHIFYYNSYSSSVGSISTNGSATAYNTSSDYRLKDNQQPLTNSGAFIDALKPKTWTWKADGSTGVGFIAHEVQEVSPSSVVGEKDGEQMQAMEYGSAEFIANIIAELQSLRKRVAELEAK